MIKGLPQAINNIPPADDSGLPRSFGERVQQEKWEEEKERMLELGRQAGDSVRTPVSCGCSTEAHVNRLDGRDIRSHIRLCVECY